MKTKLLILLLFIARIGWGQEPQDIDNKISIEIPPLATLNPIYNTPSYGLGVEAKIKENIAIYVEGNGYFPLTSNTFLASGYNEQYRLSDVRGYCVRAEIKFYLNKQGFTSGYYLSAEGFYKNQSFNWQDSIHLTPAYLTTFRDYKTVYCFNLKYGCVFAHKSGILVDFYVGLGVRIREVSSTLNPQEVAALKYSDDNQYNSGGIGDMTNPNGHTVLPNITAGFRIGYSFSQ
jgi:hypothetical protein